MAEGLAAAEAAGSEGSSSEYDSSSVDLSDSTSSGTRNFVSQSPEALEVHCPSLALPFLSCLPAPLLAIFLLLSVAASWCLF